MKQTVYYDLETGPNMERVNAMILASPFDPASVATGNLKDPAKIYAKLSQAKERHAATIYDRAALNPATAEILCIQIAVGDNPVTVIDGDEAESIRVFWAVISKDASKALNWTGSNNSGNFDLNMLCRRSWALGVKVPVDLRELTRGGDLAQTFLAYSDRPSYCGLERAAREMGIPVEETPVTGADFHKWWRGKVGVGTAHDQREAAKHYARQDVVLLREIARRILP